MKRRTYVLVAVVLLAEVLLAFTAVQFTNLYFIHVLDVTLINILLALGLNFILGYGGQISMAQAAFFGIGAYSFAALELRGIPGIIAAIIAVLLTSLVGLGLGWPTLRLKGHYLALATLGFGVIMGELFINVAGITGGSDGLSGIPGFAWFNTDQSMLYLLLAIITLAVVASVLFAASPLGLRVRAVRDDPVAAEAAGINITAVKVLLFVVSAMCAGVAGVLYSSLLGYISPDVFGWQTTFSYLAMVVIGGLGSTFGAVLGAGLYTILPEWLRFLREAYFAAFGLIMIVVVATMPGGLAGLLTRIGSVITARLPRTTTLRGQDTSKTERAMEPLSEVKDQERV